MGRQRALVGWQSVSQPQVGSCWLSLQWRQPWQRLRRRWKFFSSQFFANHSVKSVTHSVRWLPTKNTVAKSSQAASRASKTSIPVYPHSFNRLLKNDYNRRKENVDRTSNYALVALAWWLDWVRSLWARLILRAREWVFARDLLACCVF